MKRAWVHQLKSQVDKRGAAAASWYVSWTDPAGKQCSKSCGGGSVGKSIAKRLADTRHAELVTGVYLENERVTWDQFYVKYVSHMESRYGATSRAAALLSIGTFHRIAKPRRMDGIDTQKIDAFIGSRLKEKGARKNADGQYARISPATVNRELRYVRAALRLAMDWGFIEKTPRMRFLKPEQKLPTFVSPEHFVAILEACDVATMPRNIPNVSPPDWWRGLLTTLYMTGWRIGQTMKLRIVDVDFIAMTAITRAADTKGRRDQLTPLHPIVAEYLQPLAGSFDAMMFPWSEHSRTLWTEFGRIQEAATLADGSPLPKGGKNGRQYGFHDLRRGFATANAASMNLFELQSLMQHKSLATTQGYVAMAGQLNRSVQRLFVPSIPRIGQRG